MVGIVLAIGILGWIVTLIVKFIRALFVCEGGPELDREVRRIEYIDKRMDEAGVCGNSRHMSYYRARYGAEYDDIYWGAQKDAIDDMAKASKASQH
jgi:hypothetical protein